MTLLPFHPCEFLHSDSNHVICQDCETIVEFESDTISNRHVSCDGKKNHWVPNADVCVTNDGLVVRVELAGVQQEDVEVVLDGARLVIRGERRDWCRTSCKFIVAEIQNGQFECVIDFPPGFDLARATARYNNGFLRIDVPDATVL